MSITETVAVHATALIDALGYPGVLILMTMESMIRRFTPALILSGWGREASESVQSCTECGECEKKCPYELPIRRGIREGAARFGALSSGPHP